MNFPLYYEAVKATVLLQSVGHAEALVHVPYTITTIIIARRMCRRHRLLPFH